MLMRRGILWLSGQSATFVFRTARRVKLRDMRHSLQEEDIGAIAASTHGFVSADMVALCQEATMCALRRVVRERPCRAASAPPAVHHGACAIESLKVCSLKAGINPAPWCQHMMMRTCQDACLLHLTTGESLKAYSLLRKCAT